MLLFFTILFLCLCFWSKCQCLRHWSHLTCFQFECLVSSDSFPTVSGVCMCQQCLVSHCHWWWPGLVPVPRTVWTSSADSDDSSTTGNNFSDEGAPTTGSKFGKFRFSDESDLNTQHYYGSLELLLLSGYLNVIQKNCEIKMKIIYIIIDIKWTSTKKIP